MTGVSIFFFLDARYVGWVVVLLNLFIWFSKAYLFSFSLEHFIKVYRL